jgi:hypothetical protein
MEKTYRKTTVFKGKVNKYVKEWMEKIKEDVYFDETKTDREGNAHRVGIKEGGEFNLKMKVDYGD